MGEPDEAPQVEPQKRDWRDDEDNRRDEEPDWWWQTDRADSIGWALAFIWGGIVLLATNTGFAAQYPWWDGWSIFFTGVGVITLTIAVGRLAGGRRRQKAFFGLIFGFLLLGIGLGDFIVWFWPAVLLAIGIVILRGVFTQRERRWW